MKVSKKTLKNGVRILTIPMEDNPAVTVMVFAGAGSNNEHKDNKGVAHFLEHMCFKGGEKYKTSRDVAVTLDSLGAENNAFTGHEYTGYYAKGNPKHFSKMLDVVSDIYINPTLPEEELEKERGVIVEEINMYYDMPRSRAQDLFYSVMYGDQPAGWHTLGTKESVQNMPRNVFTDFMDTFYTASNTVVVVAGSMDKKRVAKEIEEKFKNLPAKRVPARKRPIEKQSTPQVMVEKRDSGQSHLIIGARAFKASDKRAPTLAVLNGVLGSGMSSRLFMKLREEMGVCYYVFSRTSMHDTHGFLGVSAGVDNKRVEEVTKGVVEEFRRLCDELVTEDELKKVKEYLVGHLYLGLEESIGVADFFVEQELLTGEMKSPREWEKEIRAVTAKDIQRLARVIFKDERMNMALVGEGDKKKLQKLLCI